MPLSEDEQRILSEIEQRLYESDPRLVREVASTTVYTGAVRGLKWSMFVFVIGTTAMVVTLQIHYMVAFVGFLLMLAAALNLVRNAQRLGRVGMQQLTHRLHAGGLRDVFGTTGQRFRDRGNQGDADN